MSEAFHCLRVELGDARTLCAPEGRRDSRLFARAARAGDQCAEARSTHTGQDKVVVFWEVAEAELASARFRMLWREFNGPTVLPPQRSGFGTEVIREAPKHELGAQVFLDYQPAGFYWSLDMPADRAIDDGKPEVQEVSRPKD
jgi:hypothetical protein